MSIRKRTWTHAGTKRSAWVVDYRDPAGKRRLKTFPTKLAAETWGGDTFESRCAFVQEDMARRRARLRWVTESN